MERLLALVWVAEKLLDTFAHKVFNISESETDVTSHIWSICRMDFVLKHKMRNFKCEIGLVKYRINKD